MKKSNHGNRLPGNIPPSLKKEKPCERNRYLSGRRILPENIIGKETLEDLIEKSFFAYNAARLKEGCRLFVEKMLGKNVTVGMSLAGALTPAGLGTSSIVPLIKAGFIDWIVSTGANLYHDLHHAFNLPLYAGTHLVDDIRLRENGIVRIYDIFLGHAECLQTTDRILRSLLCRKEFQKEMGTAEFHHILGKYAAKWEEKNGKKDVSILAAAYRYGVPVFTSSPGDSSIGMDIAALQLEGAKLKINPSIDVNEATSIVLGAKFSGGKSAVFVVGGGSPKNFILQTEPQIQETFKIGDIGHDYFLQVTDARPDTGGLSGATPDEAVSWGKIDPAKLPDAVVCYLDATVALPVITNYALAKHRPRPLKNLYGQRTKLMRNLIREYFSHRPERRNTFD